MPFYLRTGKALARRRTEITIQFKQAPLALFRDTPVERLPPNDLTLHIQPDEGVTLRFGVKIPGPTVRIDGVDMKFRYEDAFQSMPSTGYETLIYDCMTGDRLAVPARRHDRGRLAGDAARARCLEAGGRTRAADLRGRRRRAEGGRRAAGPRRPALARDRRKW